MKPTVKNCIVQTVALLAVSATAHAYNYNTCSDNAVRWESYGATMAISTKSFPAGSSWDQDIQDAMWHWNNVKGSGFTYRYLRGTSGTHESGNGVNEMYFDGSEASGSTLAVTLTNSHCYWFFGWNYGIDETDIAFNSNVVWNTGSMDYSGSQVDFEQVAEHELGHALGLNHEDRWMTTMNAYYPHGGTFGYYKENDPMADDRLAARILYPDGTYETDVAASAFKFSGSGTSTLVSSPNSAARGSNVTIEWTVSNLGTDTTTFDVGFYLSTNDFISTYDTLLGMNYGAWADSGVTGTFSRTLYIPTWISPGTYYLGFLVDPNNFVSEDNKGNNNQPMPRTITIY